MKIHKLQRHKSVHNLLNLLLGRSRSLGNEFRRIFVRVRHVPDIIVLIGMGTYAILPERQEIRNIDHPGKLSCPMWVSSDFLSYPRSLDSSFFSIASWTTYGKWECSYNQDWKQLTIHEILSGLLSTSTTSSFSFVEKAHGLTSFANNLGKIGFSCLGGAVNNCSVENSWKTN